MPTFQGRTTFRIQINEHFKCQHIDRHLYSQRQKLPALVAPRRCSKSSDFVPRFAASLLAPARSHLNQWAFAPASVPYHLPTHLLLLLYHSHASASSPGCMIEVLAPHWHPWAPSIIHYPPPSPLWPLLASLTTSFFPSCLPDRRD